MSWNALIVGLGQIGMGYDLSLAPDTFVYSHARALSLHSEFNLIGAFDPGVDERGAFQKAYQVPAYASLKQMLEQHAPELAVIASPTMAHYDAVLDLLSVAPPQAILCEKPLAYSLEEARKMLALCAENKVSLYVNYMRRSEPGALEVKRRIHSGEIAGPLKGVAWYSKGFLHNGSHFFNLLEDWLGAMQGFELISAGRNLASGDAEPDVHVSFRNGNVTFLAAKDEKFSYNSIELLAANGRLRYENGGRRIEWSAAGTDENLKAYKFLAASAAEIPSDLNRYQHHVVQQLALALKGQLAQLCDGMSGLQTLEAMHSILESRG